MNFDQLIPEPCADGAVNPVDPTTCSPDTPPSVDDRCADPAFYEANPDICGGYPRLILKPELAITVPGGQVQYHTYLRAKGNEVELTNGLAYSVANPAIGTIERLAGLFTGSVAGETGVSVTWQNLSASAIVDVVASCASLSIDFLILIDNSQSSGASFGGSYATRLAYAKEAASQFVDSLNLAKDKVAVAYFNESGHITLEGSQDAAVIKGAIQEIVRTDAHTDIAAGLQTAIDYLETIDGVRCVILFSDGEENQGLDPLPVARAWKDAGNFIAVVALRSWGTYFDLLFRISTGGFFQSAYPVTQQDVINNLKGLKGFTCSSDCQPVAGTSPTARLNYRGFVHWDVYQGEVDLIGLDQWDLQPGNGLYVDLAGSPDPDNGVTQTSPGGLKSKTTYTLLAGHQYQFKINVAGNQRFDFIYPVHVKIATDNGVTTLLDQIITPTSFDQPFTTYTFTFTPGSTVAGRITVELYDPEVAEGAQNAVGPLVDVIELKDLTAVTTLLHDDFDGENSTTVPASYSYYCSPFAMTEQKADPTPPPVIEV